ncbi:biotin--[acetyl-CoA-carboxylase] ligase [Halorussus pelagicus]|uniref:biotin--[acetyl-CoA-carboxylase] ligase n=1 Tax=Halorussus pelagicus TaxID=2505977 RepID=UPI000FFCAB61|nr:biotin--[acetyl-CoA-carboxylase] ligase [Halorussus pelagicus]
MNDTRRAVLEAISEDPVAGPELADRLGVSRNAVWKHVEALRDAGFEIASGDDGYRLDGAPEYSGPAVEYGLDADFAVEYHDAIGSTNDRARELAGEGARDVVVLADEQTGSRGRLDREWSAPSGGIWLSAVLRPDLPPAHAPALTLAAAVAMTDVAREAGVNAEIKWPNDILVSEARQSGDTTDETADRGGKKLAGILTEMEGEAGQVSWVVVGVGLNANVSADELPEGATSIREEVGDVDRRVFVQRLLERFDELRADPETAVEAWRDRSATLGQRVRVETPTGEIVGEAIDVAFPGALVIETDDGERVHVHAGDCEHLRPV